MEQDIIEEDADKCRECGMSLEITEDCCSCDTTLCYHCCKCADDCVCGCKNRIRKSEEKAEF